MTRDKTPHRMFLPARQFHHLINAGSFLGAECFDDLCLFGGLTHYLPPLVADCWPARGLQRGFDGPDRAVVKIEAIALAGLTVSRQFALAICASIWSLVCVLCCLSWLSFAC